VVAVGNTVKCFRRSPQAQQALSNEWRVWTGNGESPSAQFSLPALVIPPSQVGLVPYFAIEAYLRVMPLAMGAYGGAVERPGESLQVAITATDAASYPTPDLPLLDTHFVQTDEQLLVGPNALLDQWQDISCTLPCTALPPDSYGYGWYTLTMQVDPSGPLMGGVFAIFIRRISLYWGSEAVPAFGYGNGVSGVWAAGMSALFEKSEPEIAYRVTSLETGERVQLGSVLSLRDPKRFAGVAHPRVVSWERDLPKSGEGLTQPRYELENRSVSLVRLLVNEQIAGSR
jgi:hypothetical protein